MYLADGGRHDRRLFDCQTSVFMSARIAVGAVESIVKSRDEVKSPLLRCSLCADRACLGSFEHYRAPDLAFSELKVPRRQAILLRDKWRA